MTQVIEKETLDTNQMLRLLAQVAGRIADGEVVDKNWLIEQIKSSPQSGGDGQLESKGRLLTVSETASQLRISRWSIYDLIHKRQLLSVKIGRRRFVPSSELARYVNSLPLTGGQLL